MSIQSPYLLVSLLQGFYWFDSGLQSYLRSKGWPTLTHSQSLLMMKITTGTTRPVEIARMLGISRQAVHVTLAQIKDLGIIDFEDDPSDRRSKIVVLTDMGAVMTEDAQHASDSLTRKLAERIGSVELERLLGAFEVEWGEPIDFETPVSESR